MGFNPFGVLRPKTHSDTRVLTHLGSPKSYFFTFLRVSAPPRFTIPTAGADIVHFATTVAALGFDSRSAKLSWITSYFEPIFPSASFQLIGGFWGIGSSP